MKITFRKIKLKANNLQLIHTDTQQKAPYVYFWK